jgi:cobalt-zinc-cadmium efflux system outer membrane protein
LDVNSPPAAPELQVVLQVAEENRPDFLAIQRQASRARAELTRERRAAWPTLSISAGYTRQFQERAIGFPDANSWGAGIDVSLPLFDRSQGNIARAEATVRQADFLVAAARLDLRAEVEQALRSYGVAREVVNTIDEQALQAASTTRHRIEEAYDSGKRTPVEVLDAQAAYREVLREHISARTGLLRSLHQLNAVVGTEMLR